MTCYPGSQPAGNSPPGDGRPATADRDTAEADTRGSQSKPPKKLPSPMCSSSLIPMRSTDCVEQALRLLPEPIVRRNPTLSNPFVRGKVYELACGEPDD